MWIHFESSGTFAVRIYAGGVNVISGQSAREDATTQLHRTKLLIEKKTLQDYVVVGPNFQTQKWLDGIATGNGKVSQFVAMKAGSGYSIESQVTGEEDRVGGIQIEVVPLRSKTFSFKLQTGNGIKVRVAPIITVNDIVFSLPEKLGLAGYFRIMHNGSPLNGSDSFCRMFPDGTEFKMVLQPQHNPERILLIEPTSLIGTGSLPGHTHFSLDWQGYYN